MTKRKLIEVALPIEAINRESAREKEPFTKNHPRALHIWWARRPLAACRAVLFASLVDDPSSDPTRFPTEEAQERERQRLLSLIEELVPWENARDRALMERARREIAKSAGTDLPDLLDPFCGGGSIPLEAQRLGLNTVAVDLNPVAVLITRALVQYPAQFQNQPPVRKQQQSGMEQPWHGAAGLGTDIRHYGGWLDQIVRRRVSESYPEVRLPPSHGGGFAPVSAWIWARLIKCPNPACGAWTPMVRSFVLASRKGQEASINFSVDAEAKTVQFDVVHSGGTPPEPTKARARSRCVFCGIGNISDADLRRQASEHGLRTQLMAVVADAGTKRVYLGPENTDVPSLESPEADWLSALLPNNPRWFSPPGYGLTTYRDLFTPRQLLALTSLTEALDDVRQQVVQDAADSWADEQTAMEYAQTVSIYLALALSRWTDLGNSFSSWNSTNQNVRALFSRQAIPMTWDFVELSPFGSLAPFLSTVSTVAKLVSELPASQGSRVFQLDSAASVGTTLPCIVCTDPPYYDNIGYSELSDFFYVWLRHALRGILPDLFSTLLTPKAQELVASPYRFEGDKRRAEKFFVHGLGQAFAQIRAVTHSDFPVTLFYAFKQTESKSDAPDIPTALVSTGWETMLEGLLDSGLSITGTWPMRTERGSRSVGLGTNALASSIVLVCRSRAQDAPLATRREFISALKDELPEALRHMQQGNIAPVDLAQAAIGPGMAVFSRYSKVVEADGASMRVRTALELINQALTETLSHTEDEFDSATRWGISWFEQHGMQVGPYGEADVLARAKGVAVNGLAQDGILESAGGKVRLLKPIDLPDSWDPSTDDRLRVWEVAHHLVRALLTEGEEGAAEILRKVGASYGDLARDLSYRLYNTCERKKWAQEALLYNQLIVSWPEIARLAAQASSPMQQSLG